MAAARRPARAWLWAALGVLALLLLWAWQHHGLGALLTLDQLKASRHLLQARVQAQPLLSAAAFFALYVAATALSIPGAVILTLAAGAMFGLGWGLLIVSFASSLGALLAMLVARHLLRDAVQARFGQALAPIQDGVRRDGSAYLLTLRLVPLFPFWLINLLMGLTPMAAGRFYVISQLGMLPGTAVYVNAGTQLATLGAAGDIVSPALLGSLLLLGLFPLLARAGVAWLHRRRLYAAWPRPRRFDRNLVVIGAGAGGLVTAYIAAAVKARVTLVEGQRMGGDCLNTGCVPSKTLIRSARLAQQLRRAGEFGLVGASAQVDFAAVMQRVQRVIGQIAPHDSVARYTGLGVEVLQGRAHITSPWQVAVTLADGTQRTLSTRNIVIATGASPRLPPLPGLAEAGCLTSDTVWGLRSLPRRLLVLGGGPIGCELAQSFARLGSQVTLLEAAPRILAREDAEVSDLVAAALRADGVHLLTGHQALRVQGAAGARQLVARPGETGAERVIAYDELLCAVGRSPRVNGFGLEALGIALTAQQAIATNDWLQTRFPNIYAVGDVASAEQFTHAAAHQAWYAAVNALFGRFKRFRVDQRVIPRATFTDPEVARVGLNESQAQDRGIAVEVTRYALDDLDRAIVDGSTQGFVKVLTVPGSDRILGVTIVGEHASELLAEYVLAMQHRLGLNKLLGTVHTYPTLGEANRHVAGEWRRAHAPQRLLRWLARLHAWERR
ncbi:FAD-dependent oxidoreductase [Aquabacterium sp. OR-4]|uniref:FAD-dependent oxidoreductase n=1 Tax=Aquabacterium sp. OR-4 TaxID=2978127 RepID=UPI0021B235A6|nr:bifunctional TVP38/TMEM64 family protein/FAD-dependent oxidoreductase [Aquabacterium sp. OR-4]MDT7838679.1 FAD-dependent oxidoreductase [Aquabacterium sp. OR-4]